MCKKRACDCQSASAAENNQVPVDDGTDSDDENDLIDSDDSYSDTSSKEGASESDADSASGNRVTTDMVVWLMLKEQGVLTEQMYAEKVVECEDDIKSLIPKLPRPRRGNWTSESESSEEDETENKDGLFFDDIFDIGFKRNDRDPEIPSGNVTETVTGEKSEETSNREKHAQGDIIEGSKSSGNASNGTSNDEVIVTSALQQEQVAVEGNVTITEEKAFVTKPETVIETHQKESNRDEQKPDAVTLPKRVMDKTHEEVESKKTSMDIETISENQSQAQACTSTQNIDSSVNDTKLEDQNNKEQDTIKKDASHSTNKETKSFKYILQHLVKEKRISEEYEYVDVLDSYVKGLDKHYKNNKAVDIFDVPTKDLQQFALFLNFYSPSSYKYIVETFNTPLPEHKVLCSWYMKDSENRPGLSERAFKILRQKASGKRLTCALMWRDIFMKNYGLNYDQVDYGGGCNFEYTDKATFTFVFVLVSLDEDWKLPIGYIFAKDIPAETQAELIRVCLTQCHEAGADVVAVTLETPTPAEFLGCSFQDPKNLKTIFKHPVSERDVAVWIDPCLALRSARHTLKVKKVLQDDQGNKVRWNPIRKLRNLYSDESLEFIDPEFLKLRNHIAKVGLTTETFSESLAPALELCEELLPASFRDTAATRRYIEIINSIYDILHSEITKDLADVAQRMDTAKNYLIALFCNQENALSPYDKENLAPNKRLLFRSFLDGKPACGFFGFLICIESFKHLYATLVEKKQRLDRLNPHRLCKDHAEDFVKNVRAFDGSHPENFTGWSFQYFYESLLNILERKPMFSDKIIKFEHWSMYHMYTPAAIINLTSGKRAHDEVYAFQYKPRKLQKTTHHERATKLVRAYSKALDTETDLSTRKNMVGYLAGWIVAKFAKALKCETCIDSLCTDRKLWFHKFITLMDVKGVCLPSEEVFRVCWECERALRTKTSPARVRAAALRALAERGAWSPRGRHAPSHGAQLARAVLAKYIPLRTVAPLSNKEKKRIRDMFRLFECMTQTGFFTKLCEAGNSGDD